MKARLWEAEQLQVVGGPENLPVGPRSRGLHRATKIQMTLCFQTLNTS